MRMFSNLIKLKNLHVDLFSELIWVILPLVAEQYFLVKGVGNGKIDIFKVLTPHSRTYELRGQGKKNQYKINTQTPHAVLQKLSPKPTLWSLNLVIPRFQ